jgi:tetratricopeptide (TPR) repeat protein
MIRQAHEHKTGTVQPFVTRLCSAVLAILLLTQSQIGLAATASELFADGNRLFHDDLYWAALLRYQQATDAGMDTPLLDYNSGIAHYKAQQYTRAREALLEASRYEPLQAISHYNLGINAYRMGNYEEAMRWLTSAREQQERKDISSLANRAMRQIAEENQAVVSTAAQIERRQEERPITNFTIRARVGVGFDDNVYRSPSQTYVDRSDPTAPLVDPLVQSGMYVPISVSARYQVNSFENEGFFAMYRYGGRFYQDKALNQADEYLHEAGFGSEFRRKSEGRERRVYSAFKVAEHKETYYDPDTGLERVAGGVDISDRMSYYRYGPEFWIKETYGQLTVGARAKGQLWNYETTTAVPDFDHEFWLAGVNAQWRYSESSLIRLTAEYYTRRFGDRPSYELDGSQPVGNPTVRYDYVDVALTARQRITSAMWFGLTYRITEREDRHVGYNSYTRNDYSAEYHLNIGQDFDLEAFGSFRQYNFDNALAFNNPIVGRKDLEMLEFGTRLTYQMTDSLQLVGEYFARDVTSNDTRIAYARSQMTLAVRWFH